MSLWKKIIGTLENSFGIGVDNTVKVGRNVSDQMTFDDGQVPSTRQLEDLLLERLIVTSSGEVVVDSNKDLVLKSTELLS